MDSIIEFSLQGNIELPKFFDKKIITEWLDVIADYYNKELGEIEFIFCDDDEILKINVEYLNHDYFTDVITFDYCVDNILNGEIFISLDTVLSNSQKYNTDFKEEFYRIICHSILHLIGFKDKTELDSGVMTENENNCLNLLKKMILINDK